MMVGKFTDVTLRVAPQLSEPGMVTSALWSDVDNNNSPRPRDCGRSNADPGIQKHQLKLVDATDESGLKNSNGFWNSLVSGDFDNDGDIDL